MWLSWFFNSRQTDATGLFRQNCISVVVSGWPASATLFPRSLFCSYRIQSLAPKSACYRFQVQTSTIFELCITSSKDLQVADMTLPRETWKQGWKHSCQGEAKRTGTLRTRSCWPELGLGVLDREIHSACKNCASKSSTCIVLGLVERVLHSLLETHVEKINFKKWSSLLVRHHLRILHYGFLIE